MNLVPCPDCHRHVRVSERACPFCRAALPTALSQRAIPGATQRMLRAAAFAFTATLSLAGCGDTTTPANNDSGPPVDAAADQGTDVAATDRPAATDTPPAPQDAAARDAVDDDGGPLAMYGGPPPRDSGVDTGVDAASDSGPPRDNGGVMALYGAVPDDVGMEFDDADAPRDNGGVMALYGAAPRDAGAPRDNGGFMALYGAVPDDSGV